MTLFRFLCRGIVQRAEMKTVEQCPKHEQNTASTPSGCNVIEGQAIWLGVGKGTDLMIRNRWRMFWLSF